MTKTRPSVAKKNILQPRSRVGICFSPEMMPFPPLMNSSSDLELFSSSVRLLFCCARVSDISRARSVCLLAFVCDAKKEENKRERLLRRRGPNNLRNAPGEKLFSGKKTKREEEKTRLHSALN